MSHDLLAVIPARGGSKRIPHKNIKDFLGQPLIAYSIKTALDSGIFADVVVSTDDPEIAAVAKEYGAQVPFLRSAELSNDYAGTAAVGADAFGKMEALGKHYSGLCILYATAPLLTASHLQRAYERFISTNADYLFARCEFPFPIQRGFFRNEQGRPIPVDAQSQGMRSQDLPPAYQDAGQFYFMSSRFVDFQSKLTINLYTHPDIDQYVLQCYEMPRYRVIDIDTPQDWEYALVLAQALQQMQLD